MGQPAPSNLFHYRNFPEALRHWFQILVRLHLSVRCHYRVRLVRYSNRQPRAELHRSLAYPEARQGRHLNEETGRQEPRIPRDDQTEKEVQLWDVILHRESSGFLREVDAKYRAQTPTAGGY